MTSIRDVMMLLPLLIATPVLLFLDLEIGSPEHYIATAFAVSAMAVPEFVSRSKIVSLVTTLLPVSLLSILSVSTMLKDVDATRASIASSMWPLNVIDGVAADGGAASWFVLVLSVVALIGLPVLMMLPSARVRNLASQSAILFIALQSILVAQPPMDALLRLLVAILAARVSMDAAPEETPFHTLPPVSLGCVSVEFQGPNQA